MDFVWGQGDSLSPSPLAGKQAISYYFTNELHEFLEAALGWHNAHTREEITPFLKDYGERLKARVHVGLHSVLLPRFDPHTYHTFEHHSMPSGVVIGRGDNVLIVRKKKKRNGSGDTTSKLPSLTAAIHR